MKHTMSATTSLLARHLKLRHTYECKALNAAENEPKPKFMRRYACRCDFFERLDKGTRELLRRRKDGKERAEEDEGVG